MATKNETMIKRIRDLREESKRLWDTACDTCIDVDGEVEVERQDQAEESRGSAMACWDNAIEAIMAGDRREAIVELSDASSLASDWGDDSAEREAIALIEMDPRSYLLTLTDDAGGGYDSGGSETIIAESMDAARSAWREWAADGDYADGFAGRVHGYVILASDVIGTRLPESAVPMSVEVAQ